MNETTMIRAELPSGPLRSEKIGSLMVAKAKAQGAFSDVKRTVDGQDGNRRFKYADLGGIRAAVQAALSTNGLAWESFFADEEIDAELKRVYVWTELHHGETEQWQRTPVASFVIAASAMKQIGGSSSYLRRYQIQALLGLAAEDDNAEEAGDERAPVPAPRAAPAPRGEPERTLEPGQDPPAMSSSATETIRKAIAEKRWPDVVRGLGALPQGQTRKQLQDEYQAARYPRNGSTAQ
jgi:hypothetical protein